MSGPDAPPAGGLSPAQVLAVEHACDRFEEAWRAGGTPDIEYHVASASPDIHSVLLRELVLLDCEWRRKKGETPEPADYQARFPHASRLIHDAFQAPTPGPAHATAASPRPGEGWAAGSGAADRYDLLGEIGRGGIGVVFRGRDRRLGRDLAVKILQEAHTDCAAMRQLFVAEAQIGSQLQHPAIVPVYDLEESEDRRPYFTMKLVEGTTLAQVLAVRNDPSEGWPRLLGIFEQVCQAVAFTHSRGVIHRDLKPANIMVGAFGEVQVMDWGLARVRLPMDGPDCRAPAPAAIRTVRTNTDAAASRYGTVLGTVAYMAPEQALGDVHRLDERCDVFALGGILAEILTGRPPFGARRDEVGELAAALARLASSGADRDLIALARRCLAREPGERPRDAGEVAAAVRRQRESVEARLKAAELARAQAQARAEGERQRRRLTAGLAAAIIALGLLAGGGAWWLQRQHASRQAELARRQSTTERAIDGLLREAGQLQRRARYAEALAAVRKAEGHLEGGMAGDALRRELTDARADLNLLEAVNQVRLARAELTSDNLNFDAKRSVPLYRDAFRAYGLDPAGAAADQPAARLRERPVWPAVEGALLDWALLTADAAERSWLLQILDAADAGSEAGSWRRQLRAAMAGGDAARLRELAGQPVAAGSLSPATLENVGRLLAYRGAHADAVRWLRQAQRQYPDDFWINTTLAWAVGAAKPPDVAEAVRYYSAALALRPNSAAVLYNLGTNLCRLGRCPDAVPLLERCVELRPEFAQAHTNLGTALSETGRLPEGVEAHRAALRLQPDLVEAHNNLGHNLARLGRRAEAAASYRRAIALRPGQAVFHANLGAVVAEAGDLAAALAALRQACALDPRLPSAQLNLGSALLLLGRVSEAEKPLREAARLQPDLAAATFGLGELLRDRGEFADALSCFRRAAAMARPGDPARDLAAEQVDLMERLSAFEGKACEDLHKDVATADPETLVVLARYHAIKRRMALAAGCYREAFAARPDLADELKMGHRFAAARAAACAAVGRGADEPTLTAEGRAEWLGQAITWLQADLSSWAERLGDKDTESPFVVAGTLRSWRHHADLEGLVGHAACAPLWAAVDACVARCMDHPGPEARPPER
jgi:serine/threonine-protein kinase